MTSVGEGLVSTLVSEVGVSVDGTGSDVAEGTVLVGLGDSVDSGLRSSYSIENIFLALS